VLLRARIASELSGFRLLPDKFLGMCGVSIASVKSDAQVIGDARVGVCALLSAPAE
jgi:hypothetical protein